MLTTWQKGIKENVFPTLQDNITTDVVIIGGGIAGISTAYFLSLSGKKVVVLEKETLFKSITAYTTAFLTADIDTDASDLVQIFGEEGAKQIWKSGAHAIRTIEHITRAERIDCDFMWIPEYFFATSKKGFTHFKKNAEHIRSFGFSMEEISPDILSLQIQGALMLRNQAKFHPLKYLTQLREKALLRGVQFYEHTEALTLSEENGRVVVTTPRGKVTGEHSVMATYQPFKNPRRLFAKKGMYCSYILELAILKGLLPEGIYLDDINPYHYLRVDRGVHEDRLIVGGEDHRDEIPISREKNYEALYRYIEKYFPQVTYRTVTKWYGPILESIDGIAFIGRYSKEHPNQYVATAFSGNGMTYGTLAGEIIASQIVGEEHPYAKLYDPFRPLFTPMGLLIKTRDYIGEFFTGGLKNIFLRPRRRYD
jgi:glycine/D-amino acid oxidase-like deaminating enzyme